MHDGSHPFAYFSRILRTIKMKFGVSSVSVANISNLFSAQCWRVETSSRPFYDFHEMTIKRDLSVFSR